MSEKGRGMMYPQSLRAPGPLMPSDDPYPWKQKQLPVEGSQRPLPEHSIFSLFPFTVSWMLKVSTSWMEKVIIGRSPCSVWKDTKKVLPVAVQRRSSRETPPSSTWESHMHGNIFALSMETTDSEW